MKKLSLLFIILSFSVFGFSQTPRRSRTARPAKADAVSPQPTPSPADPAVEKAALDDALAAATPAEKIEKIGGFLKAYPASAERNRALESLTGARAARADEELAAGETAAAVELFRVALAEAPKPYSDRFFAEVVSRIPANLYWRGLREEGLQAARSIETNVSSNVNQILVLANFYASIENGDEAKRLADAAIKLNGSSAGAYIVSGHANRLNFALEEAANAYSKALEIDPTSLIAMRGKAEMQRALGKASAAAEVYREMLAKNEADNQARAGLVLSLFDAGKRSDAESEMAKALEASPGNVILLAGASYWFASQNDAVRAVELGQKAVDAEPRYIWSHIALARSLMALKKPLDAERVLTNARKYGNFPTLEYEIAAARVASGFYREAALELSKSFAVRDGAVETRLGGRIPKRERSFSDLIAYERRASIFQPASAESAETAERLKALLDFSQNLTADSPDENILVTAADDFIKGDDNMKLHRQLFVANELLQKRAALGKVLELTKAAIGNTDAALETPDAPAAVMANELYESRTLAFSRNDYLLVPSVPKQTLSAILRGRVEEITGRALFNQGNYADAVIRLRRAISVYPAQSAWSRSGMWHLGAALQAEGKDKEALDNYIQSYRTDKPDVVKYIVVENLYKKVNGTLEGFEAQVGPNPLPPSVTAAAAEAARIDVVTVKTEPPQPVAPPTTVNAAKAEPTKTEPERIDTIKTPPVEVKTAEAEPEKADVEKVEPVKTEPEKIEAPKIEPQPTETKSEEPTSADVGAPVIKTPEVEPAKVEETVPEAKPAATLPVVETPNPALAPTEIKLPVDAPTAETKSSDDEAPAKTEAKPAEPGKQPSTASPETVETDVPATVTPEPAKSQVPEATTPEPDKTEPPETTKPAPVRTEPPPDKSASRRTFPDHKPAALEVVTTDLTLAKQPRSKTTAQKKPLFEPVIITIPSGEDRPRVVPGSEIRADTPKSCTLSLSDDNVSVINDGGSVGVLVTLGGDADVELNAASSSPKDLDVKADPVISGSRARRFYIIKSISTALGLYDVAFTAPCGQASVKVRVR